jgi:hypothetical protein
MCLCLRHLQDCTQTHSHRSTREHSSTQLQQNQQYAIRMSTGISRAQQGRRSFSFYTNTGTAERRQERKCKASRRLLRAAMLTERTQVRTQNKHTNRKTQPSLCRKHVLINACTEATRHEGRHASTKEGTQARSRANTQTYTHSHTHTYSHMDSYRRECTPAGILTRGSHR